MTVFVGDLRMEFGIDTTRMDQDLAAIRQKAINCAQDVERTARSTSFPIAVSFDDRTFNNFKSKLKETQSWAASNPIALKVDSSDVSAAQKQLNDLAKTADIQLRVNTGL